MFDDVTKMEEEIKTFRKNIVASSELVESIIGLTEATRLQQEAITASSNEIKKEIDSCTRQIKADNDSALHTFSTENSASMLELQEKTTADLQEKLAKIELLRNSIETCWDGTTKKTDEQLRQLSETSSRLVSEMRDEQTTQQSAFAEKLQHTERALSEYQSRLEQKYDEFIQRLEKTNADQIFKEVQELKKSVQTKFIILLGVVGITLIMAVLGLFM